MAATKALGPDMSKEKILNATGDKYGGERSMSKAKAHLMKGGEAAICPHGNTSIKGVDY